MQLFSNLTHYLPRSPQSTDKRPDNSDNPASHGVEETREPEVIPGVRSRSSLSDVVGRNFASSISRRLFGTTAAARSEMRQRVKTDSDEGRLFPSYRKSNDDVLIKPGQTFGNTAKSRVHKHAGFRPVDLITPKGKDSGPVRAWENSNVNGYSQRFPSRHPLSSPTLFDDENRAMKKRRHSSDQVIDLDADDDNFLSPHNDRREWRRNRIPSIASAEIGDEKEVIKDPTQVFQVPEDDYSEAEDKSTEKNDRTELRSGTIISTKSEITREKSKKASKFVLNVESNDDGMPAAADDVELKSQIAQRSNSDHWDSDGSESPDELQKDITVGTYSRHFGSHQRGVKSELSLNDRDEDVKRINRRQSPNDIRPTVFNTSNRTPGKKQSKIQRTAKSHRHLFEIQFFRYGDVEVEDRNMQLFLDGANNTIGLLAADQRPLSKTIPIHRVVQVLIGIDGSLKCRFKLSKIEGTFNHDSVDIEFGNEADKNQLCTLLKKKGINLLMKQGSWMDKAFNNVLKVEPRRDKRPSAEISPGSQNDGQPEPAKRQRLSATLQGEDYFTGGIRQPSRRVPLNTKSESISGRTIGNDEEKKYQASSKNRQTRSKTRQALVDLVENEPATTTYNVPSGNGIWSKPLVYPREGKKKAEVDSYDLERLRDGEFLNDNLIGFYLRFLEHHLERNNPEVAKRVYFFNSYFFATLTSSPKGKKGVNYEAVQKWTRNVDLFSHDYVIVPINENAHWYLAIICNLGFLKKCEEDIEPDVSQKTTLHQQLIDNDEIPETPPHERSTPEESARDSFASMKISPNMPGSQSRQVRDSDDEWPEKEENHATPPATFQNKTSSGGFELKSAKKGPEKAKKPKRTGPLYSVDQPTIVTFDSLGLGRSPAVKFLRSYLLEEASAKQSLELSTKDIKGMTAKEIPLQPNYSDCGLYLLAYLEKFVQDPDAFIRKLLQREMSAEDDWPALKSGLLRRRLRDFLFELHEEQETSGDNALVDARPVSYLLGPSNTGPANNVEFARSAHVAESEVVPGSIQEESNTNDNPALSYDSTGEAVVRETQLRQNQDALTTPELQHESKVDGHQRTGNTTEDHHGKKVAQLPQTFERKSTTKSAKPGHSPAQATSNFEAGSNSERRIQAETDIFDDMYDFLSQEIPVPKNTIEVQIPTIQVPRTPPPVTERTEEVKSSPRRGKSRKKGF
ncbi:hypothetical protein UA08_00401 [Talaromyces atroroseus]|uniref:Ubiquitin-like protease family profile domain-containing protein n=1 Tax=Talaromyces atroroseus TaxID=1441469 RepID=A0A225B3U0_TALAT|nr:hypothetical protein UA08_00401 [Talaromyces atroroseus]OKL64388.1 hypothetical protein UA08_00401 [Talaromyces atroroseus]